MNFLRREDGAVALIFGLMAIPFMALVGWSVDYLRLQHVKDFLQAQADTAVIHALNENPNGEDAQWALAEQAMRGEISRQYQGDWANNVGVTGSWVSGGAHFRVTATADVPLTFMLLVPGIPDVQNVVVTSTAELLKPKEIREAPTSTLLDPDAGDYNRIWMYCYWPDRPANDPSLPKRTHMTPIADNGGSTFTADLNHADPALLSEFNSTNLSLRERGIWDRRADVGGKRQYLYFMPECPAGSFMSFRLENVRFSRTQPRYWDAGAAPNTGGDKRTGRFDYFTDTYFNEGSTVEQYAGLHGPAGYVQPGQRVNILETILCDTKEQCKPTNEGGIIPHRLSNRNPMRATQGCEPGKYMYYGWEDRPPGLNAQTKDWQHIGWTDRDYDDIRIIIKCPSFEVVGDRHARLVG